MKWACLIMFDKILSQRLTQICEAVITFTPVHISLVFCERAGIDMGRPIEIICVGNEVLIGRVVNTNSQWLAKRVTTLGLNVSRITTIGDEVDEIAQATREALEREPQFIVTTGGLGPTFDDKTLEGIAKALSLPLQTHDEALKLIQLTYRRYAEEGRIEKDVELTPPRVKMAKLPRGGEPLPNPVGTAPGVQLKHEGTTILALPGVPLEMKSIFDESVMPMLKRVAGNLTFYEISMDVTGLMESEIAPLINHTMQNSPYVYIKSHPSQTGEGKPHLMLHLSTTAVESTTAKNRVSKALMQITELIQTKGGKTRPTRL